jgi:hypothetical protein
VWSGPLVPIMALAYENHPDPELRPFDKPVDDAQRSPADWCRHRRDAAVCPLSAAARWLPAKDRHRHPSQSENRPQRTVPLQVRPEVQEMLWFRSDLSLTIKPPDLPRAARPMCAARAANQRRPFALRGGIDKTAINKLVVRRVVPSHDLIHCRCRVQLRLRRMLKC